MSRKQTDTRPTMQCDLKAGRAPCMPKATMAPRSVVSSWRAMWRPCDAASSVTAVPPQRPAASGAQKRVLPGTPRPSRSLKCTGSRHSPTTLPGAPAATASAAGCATAAAAPVFFPLELARFLAPPAAAAALALLIFCCSLVSGSRVLRSRRQGRGKAMGSRRECTAV